MRISVTAFLFISSILFACLSTSPPSDPLQYRMWHAAMLIWHDVLSALCQNIFLARWTPCSAGPQSLTALGKRTAAEGSWAGCEPTGSVGCVWQRLWTASVTAGAAGCSHAGEPVNHFRNANSSNVWLWEDNRLTTEGEAGSGAALLGGAALPPGAGALSWRATAPTSRPAHHASLGQTWHREHLDPRCGMTPSHTCTTGTRKMFVSPLCL